MQNSSVGSPESKLLDARKARPPSTVDEPSCLFPGTVISVLILSGATY